MVVTSCAIVACAPVPEPGARDVEYYRKNLAARESQLARCANDPGRLLNAPDCVNAREAARMESIGTLRNLPPMDLPVTPPDSHGK
jgi:hypothetical protein